MLRSAHQSRLIAQHEQLVPAQFCERDGSPVGIKKLHVERFRRMNLDNRADLPGNKTGVWLVLKDCHNIEQLDRCIPHGNFISRNR